MLIDCKLLIGMIVAHVSALFGKCFFALEIMINQFGICLIKQRALQRGIDFYQIGMQFKD